MADDIPERNAALKRYADSRNRIVAQTIRDMPQPDFDLLYAHPDAGTPAVKLSFDELVHPAPGWSLAKAERLVDGSWLVWAKRDDGLTLTHGGPVGALDLAFIDARAAMVTLNEREPQEKSNDLFGR